MEATHASTLVSSSLYKHITIRPAIATDIQHLPTIEQSASGVFKSIPDLAFITADPPLSTDVLHSHLSSQLLWVAVTNDDKTGSESAVAFLAAKCINLDDTSKHLYIAECSVHTSFQRQGIAGRLIETVAQYAREQGYGWLTLITFLDVPWNGGFYQRHGFEEVEADVMGDEYVQILREELGQWKDWDSKRWRRGVMARKL